MRKLIAALLLASMTTSALAESEMAQIVREGDWRKLEADNGLAYYVDVNPKHVLKQSGLVEIFVYIYQGSFDDPMNYDQLSFNCQGYFFDEITMTQQYVPPRSIVGVIQDFACHGKKWF